MLSRTSLALAPTALALVALSGPARAADFTVHATVTDIDNRPVSGIQVALGAIQVQPFQKSLQPEAMGTTDATGKVTVQLSTNSSPVGATVVGEDPGRVHVPADPIQTLSTGDNTISFQLLPLPDVTQMAAGGSAMARGYFGDAGQDTYPALDTQSFTLDNSPLQLWKAKGGQPGRPVLLVQGLFVTTVQPTPMQVFNQAFDLVQGLRKAGRDVWVLAFADPLAPFQAQALAVSDAVRMASTATGGAKVDVVGLSVGGLAARYALARDEAMGGPSKGKVDFFATVDTPHQGANIQVGVQAALWVAAGDRDAPGTGTASRIMFSPMVQALVDAWVGGHHFDQDTCGFPLDGSIQATSAAHDAFFAELTALNGDGYPHLTHNIAVAGSASAPRSWKVGDVVYRLTASADVLFTSVEICREDYQARADDVLSGSTFPGSLLPDQAVVNNLTLKLKTDFEPTFVPLASALDQKGGASAFAAMFMAPSGEFVHGTLPDEAVPFLLQQLTGSAP